MARWCLQPEIFVQGLRLEELLDEERFAAAVAQCEEDYSQGDDECYWDGSPFKARLDVIKGDKKWQSS